MSENPNLTLLLDKLEAVIACGAGRLVELATFLGKPSPRVSEWINQRKFAPGGEITILLQQWLDSKLAEIAASGGKVGADYKREFRRIQASRK